MKIWDLKLAIFYKEMFVDQGGSVASFLKIASLAPHILILMSFQRIRNETFDIYYVFGMMNKGEKGFIFEFEWNLNSVPSGKHYRLDKMNTKDPFTRNDWKTFFFGLLQASGLGCY